jgi:hypothetical protein
MYKTLLIVLLVGAFLFQGACACYQLDELQRVLNKQQKQLEHEMELINLHQVAFDKQTEINEYNVKWRESFYEGRGKPGFKCTIACCFNGIDSVKIAQADFDMHALPQVGQKIDLFKITAIAYSTTSGRWILSTEAVTSNSEKTETLMNLMGRGYKWRTMASGGTNDH